MSSFARSNGAAAGNGAAAAKETAAAQPAAAHAGVHETLKQAWARVFAYATGDGRDRAEPVARFQQPEVRARLHPATQSVALGSCGQAGGGCPPPRLRGAALPPRGATGGSRHTIPTPSRRTFSRGARRGAQKRCPSATGGGLWVQVWGTPEWRLSSAAPRATHSKGRRHPAQCAPGEQGPPKPLQKGKGSRAAAAWQWRAAHANLTGAHVVPRVARARPSRALPAPATAPARRLSLLRGSLLRWRAVRGAEGAGRGGEGARADFVRLLEGNGGVFRWWSAVRRGGGAPAWRQGPSVAVPWVI